MKKQNLCLVLLQVTAVSQAILYEEVGKHLPTNYNNHDILARRRHPLGGGGAGGSSGCNFNGIRGRPKVTGSGRTFFDLQFLNVGYHENYEINCGSGHPVATAGAGSTGLGGQKPLLGSLGGGQGGGHGGIFSNKPSKPILSMILANRPLQGIFSQSQSQTQTQTGILGDALSGFVGLLPKPHDIGQGLGDGISSFIQTLPQIGQSFQSLLPSFENFQLPSLPSLPPFVQAGSQSMAISGSSPPVTQSPIPPAVVTPAAPDLVTEPTVDPDDIIYNDDIKPVHEDPDVTGPHTTNKLPPGQYLVASHPLLGSYTQDLSEFDYLNPFKIHKKFGEEVADFFSSLFRR
ncbi:uncharacterized protein LOC108910703 isoform X2 [Anoplophora glabripennis]|uniref:uncharacterized protein LOC108910703 isoform X2 n=1 Tax=Anoplophora glabripennis TaxID=217634 RepID=UPI000874BEC8|nr:uncharacterized protein LOC108910703 isoform X2 [Anoplophora glabripennis]XP_018570922.1 uncharacterized protein LOC108910703 isoform X2 [Anoplophora glabripennis]